MKIDYSTDAVYIEFNTKPAVDSIEIVDGVIFDLDEDDEVTGVEILDLKYKTPEQIKKIHQYTEYPIKPEYLQQLKDLFGSAIPCGV
ncbi:DUF2283 domain-containing protein [Gloeocapsopsis dulcis]|uniref:DUF2283 domain-containing protein n=1 Tax=Gloeocapsopsis dulcis AAB1 = 1H9 TaxID=1433147 RepID=A0A6N8G6R3_9CHRO|nr:DUF2283 domain-containing protein [Gloeocapsopsis dulcis]MUL39306.1 hypothetical protein [Gloeocapsopsis dulcis AAB1 = 1H9]WNN87942.1 DUF2283 domain-containing protein [Gloeocapsopsis dulcis]